LCVITRLASNGRDWLGICLVANFGNVQKHWLRSRDMHEWVEITEDCTDVAARTRTVNIFSLLMSSSMHTRQKSNP
jgi:hypothetical protein